MSNVLYGQKEWVQQYNEAQQAYANDELDKASIGAKSCLKDYLLQSGELNSNYQSILRLLSTISFEQGAFEEGVGYAEKEVSVLDQMGASKDLTYAAALYNLGSLHQQTGDNALAIDYVNQTLEIYGSYYADTDAEVIYCQWKLASSKLAQDNIDEAFDVFKLAFANYGSPEEITMEYLSACYDFGIVLVEKKDYTQSVVYLGVARQIYQDSGFEGTAVYNSVVETLANAHQHVDRNQAEVLYQTATTYYDKLGDQSSSAYISLMNNRAVNLQALGKTTEAEQILQQISTGDETSDVSSLNNLATISQQKGDFEQAELLYQQAMDGTADKQSPEYAEVLENLAMLYLSTSRIDKAKEYIDNASKIFEAVFGTSDLRYASSLRKRAVISSATQDFDFAKKCYEQALVITSKAGVNSLQHLQGLNGLAVLYQEMGRYNPADSLFEIARSGAKERAETNKEFYALMLNNHAALKEIKGEHFYAKDLLQQSMQVSESTGMVDATYLATLENLSTIYIELGEYNQAEVVLQKSQQLIADKFGETSSVYAANILNFGRLEQAMGQYPKAEPHFKLAIELMKTNHGETHPEYARALNAMALFFQLLGNMAEAEPLLEQSREIYERVYGKSHPEYITAIENLSSLYQILGENDKALPLLEEALAIDKIVYGEAHPIYATTLHNLASLYQNLERASEAEPLFVQALAIDEKIYGKYHRSYANTLYNLGTLYQDLGKYDDAEKALLETLDIRRKLLGEEHPDYAYSLYGIASLYHATQQYDKAYGYYEQVIDKYIKQIDEYFPSMSEKEKSAFYAKIKPVFDAFFDFCIDYQLSEQSSTTHNPISAMYNLQLSTKALLLNASNKVRDRILNSGDADLIITYRNWISAKERLVKYFNYTQQELLDQQIDIALLKQGANTLEKELSAKSTLFASLYEQSAKSWVDVKNTLDDKEAAIEIIRVNKKFKTDSVIYIALVVTNSMTDAPDYVVLKDGNKMESRLFNYYRNAIKFSIGNQISYDNYWQPINEKIKGMERIYFSADGIYNKININTLWDPVSELSVIEELDLRIVSNTRELTETKISLADMPNTAEVYGFPDFNLGANFDGQETASINRTSEYGFSKGIASLPGTKVEVDEISVMLAENNWQGNVRTMEDATEEKIKNIDSPKLLHIATHGFFMNDIQFTDREQGKKGSHNDLNTNPLLRSGVLLTGSAKAMILNEKSKGEDGIVTAYEAMNLNLDNTELVVLSACETGLGEVRNGEGVYGLQRAFIVAGAQNVIMSLWKVNDVTTQELMSGFYRRWFSGMNKFEAFKKTQLELKKKYNDPYHWGSFVLLGK